jgi:hypothetical protein
VLLISNNLKSDSEAAMIRLLVCGKHPKEDSTAIPLRGATLLFREAALSQTPLSEFDAVAFVLPDQFSIDEVRRLAGAGKDVLIVANACESYQDLAMCFTIQSSASVQIALLNPLQFLPSRNLIRQRIDSGKLGVPGLVRIHSWWPADNNRRETVALPSPLLCERHPCFKRRHNRCTRFNARKRTPLRETTFKCISVFQVAGWR